MDIGKLHSPEPGGRQDPKVDAAAARNAKRAGDRGASAGHSLDARDSVSLSARASERRSEVEGFVQQLRDQERTAPASLDTARIDEIREKLASGHYEQAATLDVTARRLLSGLRDGSGGMAAPTS